MSDEAAMLALGEDYPELRQSIRKICERYPGEYWRKLEAEQAYPTEFIEELTEAGFLASLIPEEYGGSGLPLRAAAVILEEINASGCTASQGHAQMYIMGTLLRHGSAEQKQRYLPRMATGEVRAAMALTEPGGGSDLQAITTTARRHSDGYLVNGAKTWITNARRSQLIALLCKTDPDARPRHAGISILLVEHGDGLEVSRDLPKLGYKGVESCELTFTDFRVPGSALLGEREGEGFAQMMRGLEIGRIQVASRALGVGQAALDDALRYAQQREAFGKPIWKHQSIGNYLADMVTKLTAARQLILYAARCYDSGRRADMEAGMAKLFASETAMEIALDAVRIHGGYGYSTEFDVERYFRDARVTTLYEGTSQIQKLIIGRALVRAGT